MYFQYGDKEIEYLKSKDKVLGEAIDKIGHIDRETEPDLFASVVHHIIAQQISKAAQTTVWQRMNDHLGSVTAESICQCDVEELQKLGMTFKKAEYIKDVAEKVNSGEFDIEALP